MSEEERFSIGQRFSAAYDNRPLPEGKQYPVGLEVTVCDEAGNTLAYVTVTETDGNRMIGIVTRLPN